MPSAAVPRTPPQISSSPLPPLTSSPDPLMIGPYSRRARGATDLESPDRTIVVKSFPADESPPLKRKTAPGGGERDAPLKRRASGDVFSASPARSPGTPGTLASPSQESSPSRPRVRKPKLEVYVELPAPPKPKKTTNSAPKPADDGYHSISEDDSEYEGSPRTMKGSSGIKVSGKRTGGRDQRAAIEKLVAYLEDVFEAEDTMPLPSDLPSTMEFSSSPTAADVSSEQAFFSIQPGTSEPVLTTAVMRKLTKYFEACTVNGGARSRRRSSKGGALSEVDVNTLSRVLRILERSVKAGVDVEAFSQTSLRKAGGGSKAKVTRPKANRAGSSSLTPSRPSANSVPSTSERGRSNSRLGSEMLESPTNERGEAPVEDDEMEGDDEELTDAAIQKCHRALDLVSHGLLGVDSCLTLLTADTLPKQVCRILPSFHIEPDVSDSCIQRIY